MFIGEDLNDRQVAVLQAVADASFGYRFASLKSVKELLHIEMSDKELDATLGELETECLVDNREIRGEHHVGLTEDGERCNRIHTY